MDHMAGLFHGGFFWPALQQIRTGGGRQRQAGFWKVHPVALIKPRGVTGWLACLDDLVGEIQIGSGQPHSSQAA